MRKRKDMKNQRSRFPIVADTLGIWEEVADEPDITDQLGSYSGAPQSEEPPAPQA